MVQDWVAIFELKIVTDRQTNSLTPYTPCAQEDLGARMVSKM